MPTRLLKVLYSSQPRVKLCPTGSMSQGLWNLQSRSTTAADNIVDALKMRLVGPNSTRWNSTYDSVVVFNNLLNNNRGAVHRVMTELKLQTFTESDVDFLTECAQVISNVAKALDKTQGGGSCLSWEPSTNCCSYRVRVRASLVSELGLVKGGQGHKSVVCQTSGRHSPGRHHKKVWAPPGTPRVPADCSLSP
ncbi:hypothetical protein ILYODFUR_031014 [Ilyodon furcidens]|uniref:Uncharacterized protein n=1 Tax=Ilyodon furcidens TaxID=33524 RepID=A0ABV0V8H4_9TELE